MGERVLYTAIHWSLLIFAAIGVAYCLVIVRTYWNDRRARHIAALATSWCVLSGITIWQALNGALSTSLQVVLLFGLANGDYALIWLWSQHWKALEGRTPRRRSTDLATEESRH